MIKSFFFSLLGALLFVSCDHVEVIVTDIPANTPENSLLYISGNFNFWDPGDDRFLMTKQQDGYHAFIPRGFGQLEFKFTRGDWTTVETSTCGEDIENRVWNDDENIAKFTIKGWHDLDAVDCGNTIIALDKLPSSTPPNTPLYLSGTINGWKVGDYRYQFKQDSSGVYFVSLSKQHQQFECQVNRGTESTIEADKFGFLNNVRIIKTGVNDTIWLSIENWADLVPKKPSITLVATIPDILNADDKVYLASEINDWNPGSEKYIFKKIGMRKYAITLPLESNNIDYKLTLGSWSTVECNESYYDIENRHLEYVGIDSIFIEIPQFKERPRAK